MNPKRSHWKGRLGFVLAAAGSAVGLGNLWKFPYITRENDGGGFVLVYLACILLVGFPIMVSEIMIGKLGQRDPMGAFRRLSPHTPFKYVGLLGVITGFLILTFYAIVSGWTLEFILRGTTGDFFPGKEDRIALAAADARRDRAFTKYLVTSPEGNKLLSATRKEWPELAQNDNQPENSPSRQAGLILALANFDQSKPRNLQPEHCALLGKKQNPEKSRLSGLVVELRQSREKFWRRNQSGGKAGAPGQSSVTTQSGPDGNARALYQRHSNRAISWHLLEKHLESPAGKAFGQSLPVAWKDWQSQKESALKNEKSCLAFLAATEKNRPLLEAKRSELMGQLSPADARRQAENREIFKEFLTFISNDSREMVWQFLILVLCAFIVWSGVSSGIEKASRILMPLLLVIMVIIAGKAISSDPENKGLSFLFNFDFSGLTAGGLVEALGHSFFTLSLGMGAMITYGSYLSTKTDTLKVSVIIVVLDTIIALLACLMVFPIIFANNLEVSASAAMLFTVVPMEVSRMVGGSVFVLLFYLLVLVAALTSAIALLEVIVSFLHDELKISRHKSALVALLVVFAFGAPQAIWGFEEVEAIVNYLLPIGGLFISLYTGWFLGRLKVSADFHEFHYPAWVLSGFLFLTRFVAPAAVLVIILYPLFS